LRKPAAGGVDSTARDFLLAIVLQTPAMIMAPSGRHRQNHELLDIFR
jgi:hypothetical protein